MPKGFEFDRELVNLWECKLGREECHLPSSISAPILARIECPFCQSIFSMLGDCSRVAWQFLESVECSWNELSQCCILKECLLLSESRDTTCLDNH